MLNLDCGIYSITSPSGRVYIGSAVSFRRRWKLHRAQLRAGNHHCPPLQRAADKYGVKALRFSRELIAPKADLIAREQEFIDANVDRLYNVCLVAGNSLGVKRSPEAREKMAAAKRGIPRYISPEHRAKIGAANVGKKHSAESKEKMAAAKRGRTLPAEHIANMAKSARGRKQSNNSSGYSGVTFQKGVDMWRARFKLAGKIYNVGYFRTPEAANDALCAFKANLEQA